MAKKFEIFAIKKKSTMYLKQQTPAEGIEPPSPVICRIFQYICKLNTDALPLSYTGL
jgi:hypothetical protein